MTRFPRHVWLKMSTLLSTPRSTHPKQFFPLFIFTLACLPFVACADSPQTETKAFETNQPIEASPAVKPSNVAGASGVWTQDVHVKLANDERAIRDDEMGGFRVTHRQQGFVARFAQDTSMTLRPRAADGGEVELHLAGVGRAGVYAPMPTGDIRLGACGTEGTLDARGECLKRLEIEHAGVLEWWESRAEGLEQGFVIKKRPAGAQETPLELDIAVEGAQVEVAGDRAISATLRVDERIAWSYAGLRTVDARGKDLVSWVERSEMGGLRLVVQDQEAAYPIEVDPVLSATADWTAEPDQPGTDFGWSVSSAGDVNNDGFGDVFVGAPYYDNGQTDEGRAFVYLGSSTGLSTTAAWMAESDQTSAHFGNSGASAGDVNGDGYGDLIVGAWFYSNGLSDEGRAYVYLGSSTGLGTTAAWVVESDQAGALFGRSVASAGDVNGDGYGDVIVGAPYYDKGQTDEGRAFVYLGSPTGLSTTAAWTAESNQVESNFGTGVSSEDVNGDGFGDVIVGASNYSNGQMWEGRAYVYLGSATGLSTTAAWTAESDQARAYFGLQVASAGDVNGDGFGDVIIGADRYDNGQINEGRAYVYLGSATGLGMTAWTVEPDRENIYFGISVAGAGDVNGDGFGDVIVGAYRYSNGQTDEGGAYVYLGSPTGLGPTAAWTAESDQDDALFGWSVSGAGDVNGDGYGDVIVGAQGYDNGQLDEGKAFLYLGGPGGSDCGNSIVDPGETCDDGNTAAGDCCSPACAFEPATRVCRAAAGACDAAEMCTGTSATCPADAPASNGTTCDDSNACTQADTCQAGACIAGTPVTCAAQDPCHDVGSCDPATGLCDNPAKPDGASCDDGNGCTQTDTCQAGACIAGTPVTCAAQDACHDVGTCDSSTGLCDNPAKPDETACDDGNACTQTDTCQAGACTVGKPVTCAAQDACHDVGSCDSSTGLCDNPAKPDETACDNGVCKAGVCTALEVTTPDPTEDGSCECTTPGRSSSTPTGALTAVAVALIGLRRRLGTRRAA